MRVCFFAYDVVKGTTFHFVDWVIALHDEAMKQQFEIVYVLSKNEQFPGLNKRILQVIDERYIYFIEDLQPDFFNDISLVHCHGIRQLKYLLTIRKKIGRKFKLAYTMHAYRHHRRYKLLVQNVHSWYLRAVDNIFFSCEFTRRDFLRGNLLRFLIKPKAVISFLGLNFKSFEGEDEADVFNFPVGDKSFEISREKRNIVYFAQFHSGKGHLWLLDAIRQVADKDFTLWLFGDGSLREILIQKVAEAGLAEKVIIPGLVDRSHVPAILRYSYCAVVPTRIETFGHCFVEPMAAGLAVVGTNTAIGKLVIQDNRTGFRVDYGDVDTLAYALCQVIENPDLVRDMGVNAKQLVHALFAWRSTALDCLSVYKNNVVDV